MSEFVLIHGSRKNKPYIRKIRIGHTGYDMTYCDSEEHAMRFASRAVAIHVARSMANYGNFYPKEITNDTEEEIKKSV